MIKSKTVQSRAGNLSVFVGQSETPKYNVLLAPGSGGDPSRHLKLMEFLVRNGCSVASPIFERLTTPSPNAESLKIRLDGLYSAARECLDPKLPLIGIGHSIGATLLLGLA